MKVVTSFLINYDVSMMVGILQFVTTQKEIMPYAAWRTIFIAAISQDPKDLLSFPNFTTGLCPLWVIGCI